MKNILVRVLLTILLIIVVMSAGAGCGKKESTTTGSPNKPAAQSYSGGLVTAVAGAATVEKRTQAVEDIIGKGFSLGLVDDKGKQLNSNVPENAVSLNPIAVANYADMETAGYFRTIEYVVGFLTDAGVQLESTGATITLKDFLPDLQKYVNWSFAHPDDPKSVLGLMIASGPEMKVPASAPTITAQTMISPLCSLMLMGDVLLGIESGEEKTAMSKDNWLVKKALADDTRDSAVQKIRGLITSIKPLLEGIKLILPEKAQNVLAAFEVCDRLSVRMFEPPASLLTKENWTANISTKAAVAKNLKLEKGKKESITVCGGIGIYSGVSGSPLEMLEGVQTSYRFQLLSGDEQGSGVPLYDDADAELKSYSKVKVSGDFTYSSDLGGHRLLAQGKSSAPFELTAKEISNTETRRALLHGSARLIAPEDMRKLAEERAEKIQNWFASGLAFAAIKKIPWDQINDIMKTLNRDFQPTPWLCFVEFTPVEKKTTTSTTTTKPQTSKPEIKINSPKEGTVFMEGEEPVFSVTVTDQFGKQLSDTEFGNQLMWTLDGASYFSISAIGGGEYQYSKKLDKGSYKFTVEYTHNFGGDVGLLKINDYVNIKVVPKQLSALETLFKKNIWYMEMRYDDPQIKPQSDYEMTFQEGGTFKYLNTSWQGTWSGDGSVIKMEFSYDYKSGPNMIRRWEFTGTLIPAEDGDYRNAVLKGEFKQWNEWEKDKPMKTGTWTAK